MDTNFAEQLRGSKDDAVSAQQQIGKYFRRYGESGYKDAEKHQLMFANTITHAIAKAELKHVKIYCEIIMDIFGDALKPESSAKYWLAYITNLRYFHYTLLRKKAFETTSQIYHYISAYNNKLQTDEVSMTILFIYCHHFLLQRSHLQVNRQNALKEFEHVVESLTHLFQEMLEKNKSLNFQYKDVLRKTFQLLVPDIGLGKIHQFFSELDGGKIAAMFMALFKLSTQQRIALPTKDEIHQQAQFIIETMNTLIEFDVIDKFQMQLSVQLIRHYRLDSHMQSEKPLADICCHLYEYMKLICSQKPTDGFDSHIIKHIDSIKASCNIYSKTVMNQGWFKDFLVFLNTVHTQMQNMTAFACFWRQMTSLSSYRALLTLMVGTMKLAPCILPETKLNSISCCTSFRKHIILSFANAALSTFVLYCQNVKNEPEEVNEVKIQDIKGQLDDLNQPLEIYTEALLNPLLLIINHAFKVIDTMECIVSSSQDIKLLLMRFKQAALSACTARQASSCIKLCELFLKIKNKIPDEEWPLILRRVYKVATQNLDKKHALQIRDIQMCYIASLLQLPSEIDFSQIRGQISIYYSDEQKDQQQQQQSSINQPSPANTPPQEKCLLQMLQHSSNPLRPHLKPERKKLLHWLEVQHVVKYYRSNTTLMQSVIQSSLSYYDFVITTRLTKLPTNDVPKFMSIHKYLRSKTSELSDLGRLDYLTYGHTCTKLLQEYQNQRSQKPSLDSKEFAEEKLGKLLLRKEMENMTICNELQQVKLAYDGFKAFETFYNMFDEEKISSDVALIDWEAIIDDLTALAQFLQFASYMEYSSHVWNLQYTISMLLFDNFSALRGLAFFCDHSEFYEANGTMYATGLILDEEILLHLPDITYALENLSTMQGRKQNQILLVTLQIAQYYARCSKYTYAQMLLQFVEEKHKQLPNRQGIYDIVMVTLDVIRYRLLWKNAESMGRQKKPSSTAEDLLMNQCIMGEIEQTLDSLKKFVFASGDGLAYNMLLTSLAQDMAECTANRLYENLLGGLFIVVCKCALQNGFALRMVQVMCTWMWINLQMEYVVMAQTKLKIIEYVIGIKSLKELTGSDAKNVIDIKSSTLLYETSNDVGVLNTGMEAMRRLAQVQLSPIKTGKLELSPESQKTNLKTYFKFKIDTKTMPQNELLEWTFFTVGCLNARLYFLVEDYEQLAIFYEKGSQWLERTQNDFNRSYFKNIRLMAIQHYANYLRACQQQEKAIECLLFGMQLCDAVKWDVDVVYRVNFKLQLLAARKEMEISTGRKPKLTSHTNDEIKRVFTFNLGLEEYKNNCDKAGRAISDQMGAASIEKRAAVSVVSSSTLLARKFKPRAITSDNPSAEAKSRIKAKLQFNICEDVVEIVDSDDNSLPAESKTAVKNNIKDKKEATKSVTSPKRPKKPTKSIKGTTNISPSSNGKQSIEHLDLIETSTPSAPAVTPDISSTSSSVSSSMECLNTKENLPDNCIVLVEKLKQSQPRGRPRKVLPLVKKANTSVIILEDSPSIQTKKTVPISRSRLQSNKLSDVVTETESESTTRPVRRRRNIITDNSEDQELNIRSSDHTSSSNSTSSAKITSSVTNRRRQKI